MTLNLKGKPTLINLWFTNCATCIEEIPVLNKIMNHNKTDLIVAITLMTKKKLANYYSKENLILLIL
jgi:thiol-disulfide isomerase/thioredoxin